MSKRLTFKNILGFYKESDLIKISSKNLYQVLVRLVVNLLNIKVTSIIIGSAGMALLGQFSNIMQIAYNIGSGGIMHGTTKLVALYSDSDLKKKLVVHNAVIIICVCSLVSAFFLFVFSDFFAQKYLFNLAFSPVIKASGILVFSAVTSNALLSYINGLQLHNKFIYLNIINSALMSLILLPATYFWGIHGALWGQYVLSFVYTLLAILITYKHFPSFKRLVYSSVVAKRLLSFGLMLLIASTATPLVKIITRNVVIKYCSLQQAGWWDNMNKISNTYTTVIIGGLSLYFLPKISKTMIFKDVNSEIKNALKQVIPIVILSSACVYLLRNFIITILLTEEFRGMNELFLFQCLGDVLKIGSWFFAITLMMKEYVKYYIMVELGISVVMVINAYIIIPKFGIVGSSYAYALNLFIYLGFVLMAYAKIYAKRKSHN